jgi:hypothetical protein
MRRLWISLSALGMLAACNSGDVGSRCSGTPTEDVCNEGAVCAADRSATAAPPEDPNDEDFFCRQLCDTNAECEPGFECRGVAGAPMIQACHPEDDGDPVDAGS